MLNLGMYHASKTDEFSEKFQMAFDPPPHFRKIILRIFHDRITVYNDKNHKFLDALGLFIEKLSPVLPYSTTIGFYCLDDDCGPRTFCHKMYDILQFEIMAIKSPFNIEMR